MEEKSFLKKHKVILISFFVLLALVFFAYKKLVIWEEESDIELKESVSTVSTSLSPTDNKKNSKTTSLSEVEVKGRITVTVTKEGNQPFTDALVTLVNKGTGQVVQKAETSSSGTVVFDEVPKGSYNVGAQRIGDGRIISKDINLAEGEVTSVSLAIYLDTEVIITVDIKDAQGKPVNNQAFTLTKSKGPTFSVTSDGGGRFVQSGVPPDDNWELVKENGEKASFKVAPTGENQVIAISFP